MAKSQSQSLTIAMDEMDLMTDPKYKTYVKQVDNALKGFEYTSEWADLVNALGKLNKVTILLSHPISFISLPHTTPVD